MFIRRIFALTCIGILVSVISPARAEKNVLTLQAADRYQSSSGILVGPKDSKDKFVALPAAMGKFGWCPIDLKRTFSPGRYKIDFTLYSPGEDSPSVALYTMGAGDRQEQITYRAVAAPGTTGEGNAYFFATAPFSALAIKKISDGDKPTLGVGQITLTDMQQREYPRLAAYIRLMQYPAAWSLGSPVIVEKLKKAKEAAAEHFDVTLAELSDVEKWLDLRSDAADVFCRADYLLRAAALKKVAAQEQIDAVQQNEKTLRDMLAQNRLTEADAALNQLKASTDALQATVEKTLGGTVLPETGTDIFTWLKAWELVGVEGTFEYCEPTPFQTKTMSVGEPMEFTSTWTTNTYRAANLTARYSVLTPLRTFDIQKGPLHFDLSDAKYQLSNNSDATRAKGYLLLASPRDVLLLVFSRRPKNVQWQNNVLNIEFPDGGAVGYICLPRTVLMKVSQLDKLAKFYQRLLCKQPVECVQVQKGNAVEQTFEYVERPCDWPVKPISIAPVPPLVSISRESSSKYHVAMTQAMMHAPNGWAYVNHTDTLQYEIPNIKRWNDQGINHQENTSNLADFVELQKLGCRYVRLVCGGDGSSLTNDNHDEVKKRLQQNLEWARQAGIKVSIDAHGHGWFPDGLSGEKGYSDPKILEAFVRNWKQIIEWCQPYQDVIAWYDLVNEPSIFYERESVKPYAVFMRKAVAELRPLAGNTPIMVECVNMANPVGLQFWEDLGDDNIVVGYHNYYPHMFTHQRAVEPGDMSMPAVFFPGWMPMISWTTPSWNNDGLWYYWDRWKCDAISLPVYRLIITKGYRMDCGEYGVVGYAGATSPRSGVLWIRQSMERFRRLGVSHSVWGVCGGFTWLIPELQNEVVRFWQEQRESSSAGCENHP